MAKNKQKRRPPPRQAANLPPSITLLGRFERGQARICSLAFNPRDGNLAAGTGRGVVRVWATPGLRKLQDHVDQTGWIYSLAFDPSGKILASAAHDRTLVLRDAVTGNLLHKIDAKLDCLAFDPNGGVFASGGAEGPISLRETGSGKVIRTIEGHRTTVFSVAYDHAGRMLASASGDNTAKLWDTSSGALLFTLGGSDTVYSVAFNSQKGWLASGGEDRTVKLWDVKSGKLLQTLEGHTNDVTTVAFSPDGRLLASKGDDDTVRLWNCSTFEPVAVIEQPSNTAWGISELAFHPKLPLLASSNELWQLDIGALLGERTETFHHTTGKIVLVGDHSVGKSALAHRLIHHEFKEQLSTHGQQFWVFPSLSQRRADGTECEAILWDFAGQPDYRLVHALFLDNADLALVLFDASDIHDPLHGVGFWLKQLRTGKNRCSVILVAAQVDRGTSPLTEEELRSFCRKHEIAGPISTSSLTGLGFDKLTECMRQLIPWNDKPATTTTTTFKKIKDYILRLKESKAADQIIVTPTELRARLLEDQSWHFTDAEMMTAVSHLENYGYVKRLLASNGDERILLQPELLNNLASSLVLEARRNPRGLGAIEERRLRSSNLSELKSLKKNDREMVLDSAVLLFLEHNVCFRETDPLRMETYLVFPELINLKKPVEQQSDVEDDVSYTIAGPTENVFASLVVLLGYTRTFTRTAQWHNNAQYEVGERLVCGFRLDAERDGELDFVLYFGRSVGRPVRTLFQGLFESFLSRRSLTVIRYVPVRCTNCGQLLDRAVAAQRLREKKTFAFCNDCGERLSLPQMAEPIQLGKETQSVVTSQLHVADQRTRFEQAIFRVHAYASEQKISPPETFISYAWGAPEHERWVEKSLAPDLKKAGINVLLDRWDNSQIGSSVSRFIERLYRVDRILVVGTPAYLRKYQNKDSTTGYVVASEVDLISNRMMGTELEKQSVLPLLLDGDKASSLPPFLHGRVRADFRNELHYFTAAFDLILSLYEIPQNHPKISDLRDSLVGRGRRGQDEGS